MEMTLYDEPFKQILEGEKTVEVRLYDDKRQKLRVGDIITFSRKAHPEECFRTEAVALYKFSCFKELFSSDLLQKAGFRGYTAEEAAEKMCEIYDTAEENKYGVLAIEIKVIN